MYDFLNFSETKYQWFAEASSHCSFGIMFTTQTWNLHQPDSWILVTSPKKPQVASENHPFLLAPVPILWYHFQPCNQHRQSSSQGNHQADPMIFLLPQQFCKSCWPLSQQRGSSPLGRVSVVSSPTGISMDEPPRNSQRKLTMNPSILPMLLKIPLEKPRWMQGISH